jgi:hypothetical protein
MVRVDVTSFPYPFLAVHVNCPASSHMALSRSEVKGEDPVGVKVARGPDKVAVAAVGLPPVVTHFKVTSSPSFTVLLPECDVTVRSALLGGSVRERKEITQLKKLYCTRQCKAV